MYFSVISFQEFLNFPMWAFSENVQCFVGVFFKKDETKLKMENPLQTFRDTNLVDPELFCLNQGRIQTQSNF